MKYKITLNSKVYEVEVEQGEAILLAEYEAASPVPIAVLDPSPAEAVPSPAASEVPAAAPPIQAAVKKADGEPLNSPLPGAITEIKVSVGDTVNPGDLLMIIEAMKMANEIIAPRAGKVVQIAVSAGASVSSGDLLLVLE
ncbi:MAG: biotin/lipoyl-binding protein [Oscillospiraceae bacterium]|nr:biotin/lipoyl-binding protein [Oscillospiraceae bacterium]